jgi:hypothetical protein
MAARVSQALPRWPFRRFTLASERLNVGSATDRVGLFGHETIAEDLHHLSQQVRIRSLDLLAKPRKTVHRGLDHGLLLPEFR